MSIYSAPPLLPQPSFGDWLFMNNSKLVQMRAMLRMHIADWDAISPQTQNAIANFIADDRLRQRDAIMTELGHDIPPPDDNPIAAGSPI